MILSRCHRDKVYVYCANEGTSFYVCEHCDKACDTISVVSLEMDIHHAEVQPGVV